MGLSFYNGFSPKQRLKALAYYKKEIAEGRRTLVKICQGCGQTDGLIMAHSEDYSEPFGEHIGAYTFCYRCHIMLHCRYRSPLAWDDYKRGLREGAVWTPMHWPNFAEIQATIAGDSKPKGFGNPRPTLIFDSMGI